MLNKMLALKLAALLALILFTADYSLAEDVSICVKSDEAAVCPTTDANHTIHHLSELPTLLKNYSSDQILRVYLTSGNHSLDTSLNFTTKMVEIQGAATVIQCDNNNVSGIKFDDENNQNLSIRNLTFENCRQKIKLDEVYIHTALYFKSVTYTLTNVAITGSKRYGLYTYDCERQIIENCIFDSSVNHLKIIRTNSTKHKEILISINDTKFNNTWAGLELYLSSKTAQIKMSIDKCEFIQQSGAHLFIYDVHDESELNIANSKFSSGVQIEVEDNRRLMKSAIKNSNFSRGLEIYGVRNLTIDNCSITRTGIRISRRILTTLVDCSTTPNDNLEVSTTISNSSFANNTRALYLDLTLCQGMQQLTVIKDCFFTNSSPLEIKSFSRNHNNKVLIENSVFKNSSVYVSHMDNVTFENLTIRDNSWQAGITLIASNVTFENLTIRDNSWHAGITLIASNVTIKNSVNLTRNIGYEGGAVRMLQSSKLILMTPQSQLNMVNNTASYGGGIFTDQTCDTDHCYCFLITNIQNLSKAISFSGNKAEWGGDMIYGGCCYIQNGTRYPLRNLISSESLHSTSAIVDPPNKLVFCDVSNESKYQPCINQTMNIKVFRGQSFNISLMAVDSSCSPSAVDIKAITNEGHIMPENIILTKSTCSNFSFSLRSNTTQNSVNIEYNLHTPTHPPATLTLLLKECPTGYSLNSEEGQCTCNNASFYSIICVQNDHSLRVPPSTWIGNVYGTEFVQEYCQYCKKQEVELIFQRDTDSDILCTQKRAGTMCGRCAKGYSLQLSGNKCADCKDSIYILLGILLSISFIVIGILLIILLLTLNLTVSTGFLNALIFYCNIVYINSDEFLPINTESNTKITSKVLQDTVRFLSAFQAWMNLDSGIATCFFNNYDAYISTWCQFLYPIYIWLLILLTVCASRYSSKVSKLTASNIVPVLATLLLLSYAKLLTTSIQVFSFTKLTPINKSITSKLVWELDGNVGYLKGKHIPLFMMSCLMTLIYTVPFTLLVLLGPLLQTKSNYRLFSWINKLKPLMDAFYGPYNRNYRYWPGILLLARVVLFSAFAFYSLDDRHFKFITITVMAAALFILWSILGLTSPASAYTNRYLSYLELLFLFNLGLFAARSETIRNDDSQQILAVIMTGSTFVIFCGIVMYQTACALLKLKVVRKWCQSIRTRKMVHLSNFIQTRKGRSEVSEVCQDQSEDGCTHSTVSVAECTQNIELREPLLTEQ